MNEKLFNSSLYTSIVDEAWAHAEARRREETFGWEFNTKLIELVANECIMVLMEGRNVSTLSHIDNIKDHFSLNECNNFSQQ